MKTYGKAIYGTRICAPYQSGNLSFTQKGDKVYAIRLYPVAQESVESRILFPTPERSPRSICWTAEKKFPSPRLRAA